MTNNQYELELSPIVPESDDFGLPARFARFHANNPDIYKNLVRLAYRFRQSRPNGKLGIQMLMEVLRWDYFMVTDGDEEFKLPNEFAAFYSRLMMTQEPKLKDMFRVRTSIAD